MTSIFFISFPLGRNSAFPLRWGGQCRALRSAPRVPPPLSPLGARGRGYVKSRVTQGMQIFPYVTARPCRSRRCWCRRGYTDIHERRGERRCRAWSVSGSIRAGSPLPWLFPLAFRQSLASSLTCRTLPSIKIISTHTEVVFVPFSGSRKDFVNSQLLTFPVRSEVNPVWTKGSCKVLCTSRSIFQLQPQLKDLIPMLVSKDRFLIASVATGIGKEPHSSELCL